MIVSPEALRAAGSLVDREWGCTGYFVTAVSNGPMRLSAIAEVNHSDGSVFYVYADRWGNTDYADTKPQLEAQVIARIEADIAAQNTAQPA